MAGSVGTASLPLANYRPKLGFELANRPLFEYQLAALRRAGIEEVAVVSASHAKMLRRLVEEVSERAGAGVDVRFFEEGEPRGTAGALEALSGFLGSEPFVVAASHLYLDDDMLSDLLGAYDRRPAAATVAVRRRTAGSGVLERVVMAKSGHIRRIDTFHSSLTDPNNPDNAGRPNPADPADTEEHDLGTLQSVGLYVFEQQVLSYIDSRGYLDIKEQLLPRLRERGLDVLGVELKREVRKLDSVAAFLDLHRDTVARAVRRARRAGATSDLVRGRGVEIAEDATLEGPVVLGDGCVVESGARLTGPVCLGNGSRVESGATVRDSLIGANVTIQSGAALEESIVDSGCAVCRGKKVRRAVVVDSKTLRGRLTLISETEPGAFSFDMCGGWTRRLRLLREWGFHATKRALDVAASATLLVLFAPLFAVIAVAIKRDSPGRVWYSQRRCGKGGRRFAMHKFRSMDANAERVHSELLSRKDIDGPMFKMRNDPRVTKVGRFLRKTSLDELPQLLNVLKGEMSLVGPRPLIMEEMEFSPSWRDLRLRVKPGITGLWQVNGRDSVAFHEWIANDIRYVRTQSLLLDFKILLQTLRVLKVEKRARISLAGDSSVEMVLR